MKRILLISALVVLTCFSVMAQSLTLSRGLMNIPNGDTVTYAGDVSATITAHIDVTNNNAGSLSVKCQRTEFVIVPGSSNSFCWGGSCWPATMSLSPDPTVMAAGFKSSEFAGDYVANGNSGFSIIRYRFFDMNNIADSICFFAKYDATVGIKENNPVVVSEVFPNPADNFAFINYNISSTFVKAELKVIDLLGNKVQMIPVLDNEGKIKINTESLNSGMYFYSMIIDGKSIFSRKLIVRHK